MPRHLRVRIAFVLLVVAVSIWYLYPLKHALNLGLDLQGGIHLMLGVEADKHVASQTDRTAEDIKNSTARVEHEASTSKIGEDQIFYCKQRGISTEDAISMIVHGFCKEVFKELPMEFAVEAQKLISVSLEGSVG